MRKTATTMPTRPLVPGQLALFDDCYLCGTSVALGEGSRLGDETLCPACAAGLSLPTVRR